MPLITIAYSAPISGRNKMLKSGQSNLTQGRIAPPMVQSHLPFSSSNTCSNLPPPNGISRQRNTQTTLRTTSVEIGRNYAVHCLQAMWPNKNKWTKFVKHCRRRTTGDCTSATAHKAWLSQQLYGLASSEKWVGSCNVKGQRSQYRLLTETQRRD